jgi:hypothetical protein
MTNRSIHVQDPRASHLFDTVQEFEEVARWNILAGIS